MNSASQPQSYNRILAALPPGDYQRLVPYLEPVQFRHGDLIYKMGGLVKHVYFPFDSLISLVTEMENGNTIEVGLIGSDGLSGVTALMGDETSLDRGIAQIPGSALRVELAVIKEEFARGGALQRLLLRYTRAHLKLVSQTAACNAVHTVEERLAKWLLMCMDRVESDHLELTQEFISQMIGTRRATVTVAANALQIEGLIQYKRGNIRIIDHQGLQEFACECYSLIKAEFDGLMTSTRI